MTATVNAAINQESSQINLNEILTALARYDEASIYAPVEEIQSLRDLTGIRVKDFEKIHNALLIAYDVPHARKPEVRPAIISSVRLLAINNNAADHVIHTNRLKKWVETGLDIIDDQSVYPNEYLLSAAIALVRDQWGKVHLVQRNKNQMKFSTDISSCTQDKREEVTEDTQAKVIEKCIGFINNSSPFVCSAATSLLSKQWRSLSESQQITVLEKSIDLVDDNPEFSCAAISLISHHLLKTDSRRETIANKCINILLKPNNSLQCLATAQQRLATAQQRLAAAQYAKNYIEGSSAHAERKANALHYCQGLSRNSGVDNPDEVAIFTKALQKTLQAQARGSYSQNTIATQPSATNGHGHAHPSPPSPSATNPAAFARPAR